MALRWCRADRRFRTSIALPYQRWTLTTSAQLGGAADYITLVNALQKSGAERQRNAREAFLQFCEREQLPEPGGRSLNHPSAEWRVETGDERSCLIEYGRAADIVVLGRSRDDKTVAMDLIEAALMATGRPVLIAPAEARSRLTGTVAIAWKNSPNRVDLSPRHSHLSRRPTMLSSFQSRRGQRSASSPATISEMP